MHGWENLSLLAWLALGVQAATIAAAVGAGLLRRDAWPFSHYPMFGGAHAAPGVRYFRVRFFFEDGRELDLRRLAQPLADPFHRTCETLWPEDGPEPPRAAVDGAVDALWRAARELDPALAGAARAEIRMETVTVRPNGELQRTDATVHESALPAAARP